MDNQRVEDATAAWIEVVALLTAAADRAAPAARLDPTQRSLAFGAQLVSCDAVALLTRALDEEIEAFPLPPGAATASIADLIAAAHAAATRHRPHTLPDGAGAVITRLQTLRLEARA